MAAPVFNEKHREVLDAMLLEVPGVKPGKAFGYPGYYVGGRLFACVYEEGVSLKLPEEVREKLLAEEGVEYFMPMGRARMKEWVFIVRKRPSDYEKYEDAFLAAISYVSTLAKQASRKPGEKTVKKKPE